MCYDNLDFDAQRRRGQYDTRVSTLLNHAAQMSQTRLDHHGWNNARNRSEHREEAQLRLAIGEAHDQS